MTALCHRTAVRIQCLLTVVPCYAGDVFAQAHSNPPLIFVFSNNISEINTIFRAKNKERC